jgi:hypothetical protein
MSAHDLRRGRDVLVREGTPGTVTDPEGWVGTYTVEFKPFDAADTRVTIRGLIESDLRSVMVRTRCTDVARIVPIGGPGETHTVLTLGLNDVQAR